MGISSRLPSWRQVAQVYAVIVLLIFSWTILWFFWKFPSWRMFLTTWEIAGALAFSLVTALVESLIFLCIPLILAALLPRMWFRDVFVARGGSFAATALGYMMFLDDRFKYETRYPELPAQAWTLVLPMVAVLLIPFMAGRMGWFRRVVESFADRATVFLYLMLPLSGLAMVVVAIRFLILTAG